MADFFWIGIAANAWDENIAGITPWSDTSGGATNGNTPADGDDIHFDSNSPSVPIAAPDAPISFNNLDLTGFTLVWNLAITNVTIAGTLTTNIGIASQLSCILGVGATGNINGGSYLGVVNTGAIVIFDAAICDVAASFAGQNTVTFQNASLNNCVNFSSNNHVVTFDFSTNNVTFTIAGILNFTGDSVNAPIATATTVNISGNLDGGGTIYGATISLTAGQNINNTLIGTTTIGASGNNLASITGAVTIDSGVNHGTIQGNTLMVNGGQNTGYINGILTAPATDNMDGTWGYASFALGSFNTLKLTGITGSGGSTRPTYGQCSYESRTP